MHVKILTLSSIGLLLSANAYSQEPKDIPVTYPQQYIVFSSKNTTPNPDAGPDAPPPDKTNSFQYTVQVGTDADIDNIYYHLDQYFLEKDSSYSSDTNVYVSATRGGIYYTGIQPHANGTVGFRFSSFVAGTTPKSPNCRGGADGGSGVTCALDGLPYTPNGKYTITVKRQDSDDSRVTYEGLVKDETTGTTTQIGAWSLPEGYDGRILSPFNGTVELYSVGFGKTCADIPLSNVTYSNILYNGKPAKPEIEVHHRQPPFQLDTVDTCAGVPHSTSGKVTYSDGQYTISNSD